MNQSQNEAQKVLCTQKDTVNAGNTGKSVISAMSAVSPINRVSHVSGMTGVSPLLNLATHDFSSYDSNKSYFHEPKLSTSQVDPTQINNNVQSAMAIEEGEMNTTIISASTSNLAHASSQVQEYFNQNNRKSQIGSRLRQKYDLKLSIQYKTEIGEYLAVVGNIDELGKWTDFEECKLKWTEGHFWVSENLVILNKPYFLYKYVIMEKGEPKIWEQGPNRLADLNVLQDKNPLIGRVSSQASMGGKGPRERSSSPTHKQNKFCEINDEWEYFKIKFSINDPIEEQINNQGDYMRIIGSTPKLGSNNVAEMESTEPIRMNRTQRPIEWLIDKYGQKIRPWEITISFKNTELQLPNEIIYNYSKSNSNGTQVVKEREPSRSMIIQPPESYNGELGDQNSVQWKNQQKVWIVNGTIEKADANFLGGLFFDKVGDTNVFIGTYPLREDDIQKMKEAGITGIMNLQTDQDIFQRAVPISKQKELYKQKKIKFVRFPLNDNDEDDFCANLFTGAQYLNNMINMEGLTVYLHCSSGISRAPALLIVYLCLFKRVKQWQSPYHVSQFVKAFHVNTNPNMRAVQRVVEANLAFQNLQIPISPERSLASIKQKSTDRSVTQENEVEGFYFPQMMDDEKKHKDSSSSPNRNMLPPRPNRKSAYVKQFIPIHQSSSQMNQYQSQKQKAAQQNNGTRSITPTPSAQSQSIQTHQTGNQNQTINVYNKSQNQSLNEKDLKNIMKYHENSPLSISQESKKISITEKQNQNIFQQNVRSQLNNEQYSHQETPILSPRQDLKKHDKLNDELDRKKKQLVDNNLLLEAAMKAALVVPNQVQINPDFNVNTKTTKDHAKEHLMQEIDARAKRAENLRLKRQMAANSKKNKSDEKKEQEEIVLKKEEPENEYSQINMDLETQSVNIIQTQNIAQKNIFSQTQNFQTIKTHNEAAIKQENETQLRIKNLEQIKQKQEEQARKEQTMKQINLFCELYIQELINNKTIHLLNEVYGNEIKNDHQRKLEAERIAREEAEKEVERLRKEKLERDILEKQRQQQLDDELAQKERLRRISEENELEKARLKQMMDEQEIEKMRKQLHDEHLKMLWEAQRRQETLKDIQDAEEQELERRALKRIAREKEERMRRLKQEEDDIEQMRLEKLAKDKLLQQQMIEAAELEAEQLRQQRIKNAQEELERLQNLRKEEEEKLQRIKESFEEEERQRKIFLERERQAEKIRRDHEEQIRLIKLQQQQMQLQGQQFLYGGFQQRGLKSQEFTSQIDQIKTSLVNVYYESNMNENGESQLRSPTRNKSFVEDSKVAEQNYLSSNHIKSQTIIQQNSQNKSTSNNDKQQNSNSGAAVSNEIDLKTVTDFSDIDKKSTLISQQALKQSFEDQRKVKANIRDDSIDKKCDEFFGKEAPIKFIARKGNKLEDSIQKLIKKFKITLPLVHLRQQMYLFGTQKINIEQKVLQVMVRYGNNVDRFDAYAAKNQKKMEKQLIQYMSMSQETLPQVIDKLIKGEKIIKSQIITPERNVTPENKSPITPRANQSKLKPIDNFVKRVQLKLKPSIFGISQNSYRSDSQTNNNYVNGITQMREKSGLSSRGSENSLNQSNHHFLNNSIQESIKKTRLNRFQNPVDDSFQSHKMQNILNISPERLASTSYDKTKILGNFQREFHPSEHHISEINVVNRIASPDKFQQMSSPSYKVEQKWSPTKFGVSFDQKQFQHDAKMKEAKEYFSKYQKQKTVPTQRQSPTSYKSGISSPKQSPSRKLQVIQKNGTYIAQIQINNNFQLKKYQK